MEVPVLHIPSVEEWWRLTAKYPRFRTPSNLTLKEYGYMMLFELIERERPRRVLEFGHGFSPTLFEYCESRDIEVWGVDDHMDLHYFPPREQWYATYKAVLSDQLPKTKLVLGQLGTREDTRSQLPGSYFDLVCSVSVLEELGDRNTIVSILRHAHDLLVPGGVLANTHDIVFGDPVRPALLRECEKEAGFDAIMNDREATILSAPNEYVAWNKALIENATQAMVCYNIGDLERVYTGHWTTLFSTVRKELRPPRQRFSFFRGK
jgi:SAM-dependent methyltransferase